MPPDRGHQGSTARPPRCALVAPQFQPVQRALHRPAPPHRAKTPTTITCDLDQGATPTPCHLARLVWRQRRYRCAATSRCPTAITRRQITSRPAAVTINGNAALTTVDKPVAAVSTTPKGQARQLWAASWRNLASTVFELTVAAPSSQRRSDVRTKLGSTVTAVPPWRRRPRCSAAPGFTGCTGDLGW